MPLRSGVRPDRPGIAWTHTPRKIPVGGRDADLAAAEPSECIRRPAKACGARCPAGNLCAGPFKDGLEGLPLDGLLPETPLHLRRCRDHIGLHLHTVSAKDPGRGLKILELAPGAGADVAPVNPCPLNLPY